MFHSAFPGALSSPLMKATQAFSDYAGGEKYCQDSKGLKKTMVLHDPHTV